MIQRTTPTAQTIQPAVLPTTAGNRQTYTKDSLIFHLKATQIGIIWEEDHQIKEPQQRRRRSDNLHFLKIVSQHSHKRSIPRIGSIHSKPIVKTFYRASER